ncbi:MAG TPA: NAD(P)-binding domain-containing protein [Streptosporangiaceae bacterium]|jgi:3-hydroxyisobutyrate dehydrogenase-like beta-hydroxyacid dehydrogenase
MTTEMPAGTADVTILGLGAMGRALAGALLAAGHRVAIWNRTASRGDDLAARGAIPAATPAAAVEASPLVIVCLLDHAAVRTVLDAVGGGVRGRTVVNLTNGTPAQAREAAAWAAGQGAAYLDGGIMAVPAMIGRAGFVLYSGDRAAFAAHEPALAALGEARYLGAEPGLAAVYDLGLLSAMYGMYGGFLQAVALVRAAGRPAAEFAPLAVAWLSAMSAGLPAMASAADSGDHGGTGSNLAMQAAGFPNLLSAAEDSGVRTDLITPLATLLDRAVAKGHGSDGISALADLLRTDAA